MASSRTKVLRAVRRQAHRYDPRRGLGVGAAIVILLAVPLSGLARVDLWSGRHRLLLEPAPLAHALAGVIVAAAAMYVVTFLSNVVAGRLFCGFGCPVGQISRFGEVLDTPRLGGRERALGRLRGAVFGATLVVSFVAWWVDLRVLWQGSPRAAAWTWSVLAAGCGLAWAHGRIWQWRFCTSVCPIGVYYSFVSPARWFGVHFRNAERSCVECDACDNVCPVGLTPRDLTAPVAARTGLAISDAPGHNHCLECGDCVRACEWIIASRGAGSVPLRLGHFSGPQRIDAGGGFGRRAVAG